MVGIFSLSFECLVASKVSLLLLLDFPPPVSVTNKRRGVEHSTGFCLAIRTCTMAFLQTDRLLLTSDETWSWYQFERIGVSQNGFGGRGAVVSVEWVGRQVPITLLGWSGASGLNPFSPIPCPLRCLLPANWARRWQQRLPRPQWRNGERIIPLSTFNRACCHCHRLSGQWAGSQWRC